MSKVDPIGEEYYRPVQILGIFGDIVSFVVISVAFLSFFIGKSQYPTINTLLQITMISFVVLFFVQGQLQRLYFFPLAEDKRRKQLFSDSFGVMLSHEEAIGYYNNDQTNPVKRLAASVMESAFFTKYIAKKMLVHQRATITIFVIAYLIATLNRTTNLEFLSIAAQSLFGGEIVARWLRVEWLCFRSEDTFENLNRLFNANKSFAGKNAQSEALDLCTFYETTKCTAAVPLSSALFHKHNPKLTRDWEQIRARLKI